MKKILFRTLNGFCYSVAITIIIQLIVVMAEGDILMLPEYAAGFSNPIVAYSVQLVLIGCMSSVASAGTVILELKRPGLVIQSVLYLLLMLVTWIPVACYLWGFHKYVLSMISCLLSIFVTYGICWGMQYKVCRRDVNVINELLKGKQEEVR